MGIYQCQNMGCPNGFGSTFELSEKEEQFYAEHGLSSPKNCPDCRRWRKAQTDKYPITCEACGNTRIITRERRINYHRKVGQWVDPTLCKLCEKDPNRALLERKRALSDMQWLYLRSQANPTYPDRAKKISRRLHERGFSRYVDSKTGGIVSNPQVFDVLQEAEVYETIPDFNGNALKHITKADHESLTKLGTNDGQTLIFMGSEIAYSKDSKAVTQFEDIHSGYIVKRDNLTGQIAIIKPYDGSPPPYRLVTTYHVNDGQMLSKMKQGAWVPSK